MLIDLANVRAVARDDRHLYRLHPSSWVAVIVVLLAFSYIQFQWRCLTEDFRTFCSVYYGWPVYAVKVTEHNSPRTRTHDPRLLGVLVDGAMFVALVASTAFVMEGWIKSKLARWQFSLQSLIVIPVAITVALTLYRNERRIIRSAPELLIGETWSGPMNTLSSMPIYVIAPILFGIGCATVAAVWSVTAAAKTLARRFYVLPNASD
jgi:hypothetical protein